MNNNFLLLLPEFIVTGLAFVVLGLDLFLPERRKWVLPIVAVVGLVVALVRIAAVSVGGERFAV